MLLKNNCGETSRIGYTCQIDPNDPSAFVYASAGSSNIAGIITQAVPKYAMCEIATTGVTKVYCYDSVVQGSIIRGQKSSDNISRATSKTARPSDVSYFKIGTALESGKGLIKCQLSLGYSSSSGGIDGGITIVTSSPYTVKDTDELIVVNSAVATIVYLPIATGLGRKLAIGNINIGTVTVTPSGTNTIQGEISQEVYEDNTMAMQDYSSGKWIIR